MYGIFMIILYMKYGYYYAKGSSEYVRFNNRYGGCEYNKFHISIINECKELTQALTSRKIIDIMLETSDVIHSITKYLTLTIFPEKIYCSFILWSILFFVNLPCTIKLATRYKINGCIRNHSNPENINHICGYKSK